MKILKLFFIMLMAFLFQFCKTHEKTLNTVKTVDLEKYAGKWYEIARLPNSFEKGLKCTTANYTLRKNGKITVINTGHLIINPNKTKKSKGKAWIPNKAFPGQLKVSFFWPFAGDYYIIELDSDYQYALIGEPSRKYLWILNRTKVMTDITFNKLLKKAKESGFNVEKIIKIQQDCN